MYSRVSTDPGSTLPAFISSNIRAVRSASALDDAADDADADRFRPSAPIK